MEPPHTCTWWPWQLSDQYRSVIKAWSLQNSQPQSCGVQLCCGAITGNSVIGPSSSVGGAAVRGQPLWLQLGWMVALHCRSLCHRDTFCSPGDTRLSLSAAQWDSSQWTAVDRTVNGNDLSLCFITTYMEIINSYITVYCILFIISDLFLDQYDRIRAWKWQKLVNTALQWYKYFNAVREKSNFNEFFLVKCSFSVILCP